MVELLDGTESSLWNDLIEDDAMTLAIKIIDFLLQDGSSRIGGQ